jgi:hypothetical protein
VYEVDDRDRVVQLENVPQSDVGAPMPFVAADEHQAVLAYYMQDKSPWWDSKTARVVGVTDTDEVIALIRFSFCYVHMFGPPNDEAFAGHPLAVRGLRPYRAFRIEDSSWIRKLERMNSVHPHHRPEKFCSREHLVFAFHDSTFECVCDGFEVTKARGSISEVVPEMMKLLERDRH